jgi:hypothetical protein
MPGLTKVTTGTARVLQTALRRGGRVVRRLGVLAVVTGLASGSACTRVPTEAAPAAVTDDPATTATRVDAPPSTLPATDEEDAAMTAAVPADLLGAAISDAVRRTSAARGDVEVVTAEAVTWSDGSMGCPQPGLAYTQALVPGYRIVLRAGGQTLNYHVGGKGGPSFCPSERVVAPAPPGSGNNERI